MGREMRKRKVLMLVENMSVPADPRVWNEATTLREHGYQVSVICPEGSLRDRAAYECIDGIAIYRYHLPVTGHSCQTYLVEYGIALLKTFGLSVKVLWQHGFDVIHAANPPDMFFVIGLFYRLFGKKYLFDQHDLAPEMFRVAFKGRMPGLYRLLVFLERCSYQVANLVLVTNLSQKWNAVERGHCSPRKVFVVRNGPQVGCLESGVDASALKGGRRYLLAYVGVMGVQDGVQYALYALHELVYARGRRDVSLLLIGGGDHAAELRRLATESGLDEYVTFTGWVARSEVARYLAAADIGISPDPQNGLNEYSTMIKTLEYMALARPVAAFDLTETRISAGEAALYAQPNSVEGLADAIERLLDDEALRLKLGLLGRKRIEEELGWHRTQENLLIAYGMLWRSLAEKQAVPVLSEKQ